MTTDNAGMPDGRVTPSLGVTTRPDTPVFVPRRPDFRPAPAWRPRVSRRRRVAALLVAVDCSAAVASALSLGGVHQSEVVLGPVLAVLLALNAHSGLYRPGICAAALGEMPRLLWHCLVAWCVATAVFAAVRPSEVIDWAVLSAIAGTQLVLACVGRGAVHFAVRRNRRRRPQSALVVGGATASGRRITAALLEHPEYGMRPVGVVECGLVEAPTESPVPLLLSHEDITRAVIQNSVRHAVFACSPWEGPEVTAVADLFTSQGCAVWLVTVGPETSGHGSPAAAPPDHLWGFACRRLDVASQRRLGVLGKRVLDITGAGLALLAVCPILLACALAVRRSDGPGVIFRQERIGLAGRPFTVLKFRTLRPVDEHESATRWNVADDQRMSAVGHFLRRTSLDELPQLWNVWRGDMSLVGPRPERPFFVHQFSQDHPGYAARHRMPAGITGLAQVHGLRGDTSIEDRARFDNHYIETWSLWQDVRILLRTVSSLIRSGGS